MSLSLIESMDYIGIQWIDIHGAETGSAFLNSYSNSAWPKLSKKAGFVKRWIGALLYDLQSMRCFGL